VDRLHCRRSASDSVRGHGCSPPVVKHSTPAELCVQRAEPWHKQACFRWAIAAAAARVHHGWRVRNGGRSSGVGQIGGRVDSPAQ